MIAKDIRTNYADLPAGIPVLSEMNGVPRPGVDGVRAVIVQNVAPAECSELYEAIAQNAKEFRHLVPNSDDEISLCRVATNALIDHICSCTKLMEEEFDYGTQLETFRSFVLDTWSTYLSMLDKQRYSNSGILLITGVRLPQSHTDMVDIGINIPLHNNGLVITGCEIPIRTLDAAYFCGEGFDNRTAELALLHHSDTSLPRAVLGFFTTWPGYRGN